MRWLVFAAVAAFSSSGMIASGPVVAQAQASDVVATIVAGDPAVIVTPIPMPAPVTELLNEVNSASEMRPAKKLKVAKKSITPKSMLSRTERHQVELLTSKPKGDSALLADLSDDDDAAPGFEDLDLHRSFARPKVAKVADQDDDDDEYPGLSDTVKVRLLMARMRALEVHALAWAADAGHASADEALSDAVKLRLYVARTKAVQAHQKKFTPLA